MDEFVSATDLVVNYIADLKDSIKYLVAAIIALVSMIVSFAIVYRNDRRLSDKRFEEQSRQMFNVIQADTLAKGELKNAIDNNTKVIDKFQSTIKDTIITTIKLATK